MEINLDQARTNMIEQQIRPWDVLDQRVLDTIASVPREQFVPEPLKNLAFMDIEIPLGHGQVMMSPKLEARMMQALEIAPDERILEIGTGSGYVTACLARLGRSVRSVDIFADFTASARSRLEKAGITKVTLETGDASSGWGDGARFDVVAVTGSVPEYPAAFDAMLDIGGRLFVITGEAPVMEAVLVQRVDDAEFLRTTLFETVIPPLVNAEKTPEFVF